MRICLIHCPLGPALRRMGHHVLELAPPPGLHDARALLDGAGFSPDLLVQTETLGPRTLLAGLDGLSCARVYWSLDTHLNAFWQRHYAGLFDLFLTTQAHWVPRLADLGAPHARWLPWFGAVQPWTPFAQRAHDVGFVGRTGPQRPTRTRFLELLNAQGPVFHAQDVSREEMFALYRATRVAPNEAIFGEINFRVFEASSAGCLLLTRNLPGLEELFVPGRELDTYHHALDLSAKTAWWRKHPEQAQAVGLAARARVLADHLPANRAASLLEMAQAAPRVAATGDQARLRLALALLNLAESGILGGADALILASLEAMPEEPEAMQGLLRLLALRGKREELAVRLRELAAGERFPDSRDVDGCAVLCALLLEDWDLARTLWLRRARAGQGPGRTPGGPVEMLRRLAGDFQRRGLLLRPGLCFDPLRHVPRTAVECLLAALRLAPGDLTLQRALETLLEPFPGTEETRLGILSELSLHRRQDWRLGLALGVANLRAMRVREALEELAVARDQAVARGEAEAFAELLARQDPPGLAQTALARVE